MPRGRGTGILPVKGRWPEGHGRELWGARVPALRHGQDGHATALKGRIPLLPGTWHGHLAREWSFYIL